MLPARQAKPPLTTWGMLLVAIGALILLPSGLCTGAALMVGVSDYLETSDPEGSLFYTGMALLVGGIPTIFGGLLIFLGLRLRKAA